MDNQETIKFDEFQKVSIKIGTIISVERVEDTDKLLVFKIDLGEEEHRQVVSGLAQFVEDLESLVGKQVLVVSNLEPREIRGVLSQGMLLTANDSEGNPKLIHPSEGYSPGMNLH